MKIQKYLLLITLFVLPLSVFGYYVDFSQPYGSFGAKATAGLYYDDVDVLYNAPVRILEFQGTSLLTSFGNYRYYNSLTATYDKFLTWGAAAAPYYSIGAIGKPLWLLGMDGVRGGIFTAQLGSKSVSYDLDNNGATGTGGNDSEGNYKLTTTFDDGSGTGTTANDGTIDRTVITEGKDMMYYQDNSEQVISVGFAFALMDSMNLGIGIQLSKDRSLLTTGGEKTYSSTTPTLTPPQRDSYIVKYPTQEGIDINSEYNYDLNGQLGLKMSDIMKVNAQLFLGLESKNNPNSDQVNIIEATRNVYNTDVTEVYNEKVSRSILDYNGYNITAAGWLSDNTANAATSEFEDDRSGFNVGVKLDADYEYDKMLIVSPEVMFYTRLGMSIDAKKTSLYYLNTKTRVGAAQLDNYTHNYTLAETYTDGSDGLTGLGGGLKLDFINLKDVKLAIGGFFTYNNDPEKYTYTSTTTEDWTYDDPSVVNPGDPTGGAEGTRNETTVTKYEYEKSANSYIWAIPVGTVINLAAKWKIKAGAEYKKTYTTTTVTRKDQNTQQKTVVTPQGGTATTTYSSPLNNVESESILYTESSAAAYAYGLEYNYNENLRLEFNAFLDTNAGGSLLDLATYSSLAISASYRY